MSELSTLATGLRFPEGPIWQADGAVLLVEIARGTLSRVSADGQVSVVADTGGGPNGIAMGPDGRCYVCNNGGFEWREHNGKLYPGLQPADYSGGRIERVDLATGEIEELIRTVEGEPLKGPNDIVFDHQGGFWFTDHGKVRPREQDRTGVFYARPDGSGSYVATERLFPLDGPNGIGLAPDDSELYVAETPTGRLWAYPLAGPGELGAPRRLLRGRDGHFLFDSLAVQADGRVAVATILDGGITILDPAGGAPEFVPMPDRLTTNICFGGDDLETAFVTLSSTGQLVSLPWATPGLPLAYPA